MCGKDVFAPTKEGIPGGIGPGESTVGAGQSSGYAGGERTVNTQILEETGYPEWPYAMQPPVFREYWEGFRRYLQDSKLDPKLKPAVTAGDYNYYNVVWSSKIYMECAVNKSTLRTAFIVHETEKFQHLQEHREEIDQAIKKLGESAWKEDSKAKNFHVHIPVADLDVKAQYAWFRQVVETMYDAVKDWLQ